MNTEKTVTSRTFDRLPSLYVPVESWHVRSLGLPQKPRSYTWSCAVHLDQGQLGSCVGHGFTHLEIARPKPHKGLTEDDAKALYYRAQQLDEYPGEQYEGTSVNAGGLASREKGWLKEFRWATSVDDIVSAVGYHGPVVMGTNWYTGMMDTDAKGFVHPTGANEGGHCWLVKGVSVKGKYFRAHQSWGTSWGLDGDFLISWDDLGILLADQGEAVVSVLKD